MIVVDSSALLAIVLGEPAGQACAAALTSNDDVLISAATLAEALIVSIRRGVHDRLERLLNDFKFDVVPVTSSSANRVGQAYSRWGKGVHPAALNFGDCFAYELAKRRGCPLLFLGNDFSRTDIESVL